MNKAPDLPDPVSEISEASGETAMPAAFVCLPAESAIADAGKAHLISMGEARELWGRQALLLVNAPLIRQKLFSGRGFREAKHFDLLELFAFVRPAQFCAPSAAGIAQAVGLAEPVGAMAQALTLGQVAKHLLDELRQAPLPFRLMARASNELMAEHGWMWASLVRAAIEDQPIPADYITPQPLHVWALLEEWEDEAPKGAARSVALSEDEVRSHLARDLSRAGLDERRPEQLEFALKVRGMFDAKFMLDQPNMWLLEAGTGVGKTLGYLAPSAAWLEKSGGQVWVSTFTRALQKQIYSDTRALYDTDEERQRRVVVRKGRENYLCLLNYQERITSLTQGGPEMIIAALMARWIIYSRDGDIMGGDFPGWLPQLLPPTAPAHMFQTLSPVNLIDRRGECIHSACQHYRTCFIEKAVRRSRHAEIVIANHALVMAQAAYEYSDEQPGPPEDKPYDAAADAPLLSRIIFDEGHHLFEAADTAFSTQLSGFEAYELRRWIRGNEGRSRRSRGLQSRLGDLIAGYEPAKLALDDLMRAAHVLPQEGWSQRLTTRTQSGETMKPLGPIEALLAAALQQIEVRSQEAPVRGRRPSDSGDGAEVEAHPCLEVVAEAAKAAASALKGIEAPLLALVRVLEDQLNDPDALDLSDRVRVEGALRGLQRRARRLLPAWRALLQQLTPEEPMDVITEPEDATPGFVDWFSTTLIGSRLVDVCLNRHFVDPSLPLAELVLKPAHGVLVASATLSDAKPVTPTDASPAEDPFRLARQRTGAQHLIMGAKAQTIASPFDYEAQSRLFVISDVPREDVRAVAQAMKALFLASGGGGLGLFTAIRRLKAVYEQLNAPLGEAGISLYAQHVDPLDVSDLISIFRSEHHSCLLGTDAVRDGIDVPGQALRLIAFDRVPWPRPDALHKARRAHFGARTYDDALTRARLAQAFGRLIRKADDKGVFVMLDSAAPTRLFAALPPGVALQRCTLSEAVAGVAAFLSPGG